MKVSLNLVKKFINIDTLTPEEIAHRLTFAGVEVESIEKLASGTNLVVGEVLTCENMPDSDHLHLTTVFAGPKFGTLNIVCGAPNVRKGLKVIVATDGAVLPGGTIKKGFGQEGRNGDYWVFLYARAFVRCVAGSCGE